MSRWRFAPFWIAPVMLSAAAAQQAPPPKPPTAVPTEALPPDEDAPPPSKVKTTNPPQSTGSTGVATTPALPPDSDLPPDEDAVASTQVFSFNPVKSKKDVETGDYYFKKGNYNAASERFRTATKWNQGNAEAWLRLGEAEEKREQAQAARSAYQKYLELVGNTKIASDVKKRLEKLK